MRPSFKTTREGRRSFVAMLLVALAALNTGNNLIYLVLAMMASMVFLSLVLPAVNLRGLSFVLKPNGPVFARTPSKFRIEARNGKRLFPSYSIRFSISGSEARLPFIAAGRKAESGIAVSFPERGPFRAVWAGISSGFPFIFLSVSKKAPLEGEFPVYPEILDMDITALSHSGEERGAPSGRKGEEPDSVREYRPGDDTRRISWKLTARHRALMLKEPSPFDSEEKVIVLDGTGPPDGPAFERAVSIAATLASALIRKGARVGLVTAEGEVPCGAGTLHLYQMLERLAFARECLPWSARPRGGAILVCKGPRSELRGLDFKEVFDAERV